MPYESGNHKVQCSPAKKASRTAAISAAARLARPAQSFMKAIAQMHGDNVVVVCSPAKKARTKTANSAAAPLARPAQSPMEATAQVCVTNAQLHYDPPLDRVSALLPV